MSDIGPQHIGPAPLGTIEAVLNAYAAYLDRVGCTCGLPPLRFGDHGLETASIGHDRGCPARGRA